MVAYWLMKSELDVYPWSQLVEDEWTHWDGVRNYQARNMMRDEINDRNVGVSGLSGNPAYPKYTVPYPPIPIGILGQTLAKAVSYTHLRAHET